jgi:ubiquinone/menaquinone biosynthesis C-methylase UbiE
MKRRRSLHVLNFLGSALLLAMGMPAVGCSTAPSVAPAAHECSGPRQGDPHEHDATAHHPFDEVQKWVGVFDDPGRDEWQKPQEMVRALGLEPGQSVADLGAGTGYFSRYLARAVGSSGRVYAIDTEPKMVKHLARRARKEGTPQVRAVLARPDDPALPADGVDLVLIVDTFHHIDDRVHYLERLARRLKPGGRVAVVDFEKRPLPVGPPPEHKLAREGVIQEFKQAGYELREAPGLLPYQYFLIFAPGR